MNIQVKSAEGAQEIGYKSSCRFANYLQCSPYAIAVESVSGSAFERMILYDNEGVFLGYIQARVVRVFCGIKVAQISRGMLLGMCPIKTDLRYFYEKAMDAIFAYLTKRRVLAVVYSLSFCPKKARLPNMQRGVRVPTALKAQWSSSFIELSDSESRILQRMNGKWRNLLRKSEKNGIVIDLLENKTDLEDFLLCYSSFKTSKRFLGVPDNVLRGLVFQEVQDLNSKLFVYRASSQQGMALGYIAIFKSFDTATYFIGINVRSRNLNANYGLLWRAICDSKDRGEEYFDLGGISTNTPKGVRHFKSGLSGTFYIDSPYYIKTFFMAGLKNLANAIF